MSFLRKCCRPPQNHLRMTVDNTVVMALKSPQLFIRCSAIYYLLSTIFVKQDIVFYLTAKYNPLSLKEKYYFRKMRPKL